MTTPGEGHADDLPRDEQTELMWRIIRETLQGDDTAESQAVIPAEEAYRDPVDELRNICIDEAITALSDLQEQLSQGIRLDATSATVAGILLYTLILEADRRDDVRSINQYAATLDQINNAPGTIIAAGYFAAIMAGSEHATDALSGRLNTEKAGAHWTTTGRHGNMQRRPITPLLTGVLEACAENDIPADEWIARHAIDAQHDWFLRVTHYQNLRTSGHEVDQASIDRYEHAITEGYDRLSPEYANQTGPQVLDSISRPDLRARILARYTETLAQYPSGSEAHIAGVRKVFEQVVWDPDLVSSPATSDLVSFLDAGAHARGSFVDDWQVDRQRFDGAGASELIAYIDERTHESLDEGARYGIFNALAANVRDMILHRYAQQFAARGRFDEAQICLREIGAPEVRESAMQGCIHWAQSDEDIEQIKPGQNALTTNPEFEAPFRLASAQQRGDITDLEAMAREFAQQPPRQTLTSDSSIAAYSEQRDVRPFDKSAPPPSDIGAMLGNNRRAHYIQQSHRAVTTIDSERGQQLARDLLATLRGQRGRDDNSQSIRYFSEVLMQARDSDELQYAHQTIDARGVSRPMAILKIINMSKSSGRIPSWLPPFLGLA
jgi:hypothetical protein